MQTDLLTTVSSDLFASMATGSAANAETVPQGFDFGATLLAMLSMDSLPVDAEASTGENVPQLPAEPVVDQDVRLGRPLFMVNAFPEHAPNTNTVLLYSNAEIFDAALFDSKIQSPDAQLRLPYFADVSSDKSPVDVLDKDSPQSARLMQWSMPGAVVGEAAVVAAQSGSVSEALFEPPELSQQSSTARAEEQPASASAEIRLDNQTLETLVSGGYSTGLALAEQPADADHSSAPPTGRTLPQSMYSYHEQPQPRTPQPQIINRMPAAQPADSLPGGQTAGMGVEQGSMAAREIESLFPEVKVESLRVTAQPKTVAPNETVRIVQASAAAAGEPEVPAAKTPRHTAASAGRETAAPRQQNMPPSPEPSVAKGENSLKAVGQSQPGEQAVKPLDPFAGKIQTLTGQTEIDAKGAAGTGTLESGPVAKGTDSTGTDGAQRMRYTIDPESLRPPIKAPAEIQLKIHPEELGVVKLQLRMLENHLSARVIVQSPAARMAVEGSLAELQRNLADAGLVVDRFEVSLGHASAATATDPDANPQRRRYTFRPKTNRRYQEIAGIGTSPVSSPGPMAGAIAVDNYGRLNMVA